MVALVAGFLGPEPVHAENGGTLYLSDVSIGIRGHYQVGRWTSIEGTVASENWPVDVSVRVPDPDGNPTRYPLATVEEPAASAARFRGLFKTGRLDSVVRVDLQTERETRTITLRGGASGGEDQLRPLHAPWTQQTQLWAIVGDPAGFRRAVERITNRNPGGRPPAHLIELSHSSELPSQAAALQALDVLVINGTHEISSDVNDAIRSWVVSGGHLVVATGNASEFTDSPLAQWLPLRVSGESRLRDLSYLTTQVPGSVAILGVGEVQAVQFDMEHGEAIVSSLDGPLWARLPHGFGRVTFLGVDLSRRPLVDWESLPVLCERLADFRRGPMAAEQRTASTQLSQTGVSDLQTQLTTGLDQFPQVRQSTTWMVLGSILLFLVVVGPLDYVVVHKLLRRPHWTWITFPLLVVAAAGAAATAAKQRSPSVPLANQVDLIDVDTASESVRARSWMSFTSPNSDRYRVDAAFVDSAQTVLGLYDGAWRLGWTGIPETGFRGMYRTGGLDLAKPTYTLSPTLDAILDLPVMQRSSASTTAEWTGRHDAADEVVSAELQVVAGQLTGTITNRTTVPLQDWFIAHEGRVYVPETRRGGAAALTVQPGEVLNMTDHRRVVARVLKSYLTGVRRIQVTRENATGSDAAAEREVYNPLERDPYTVLRMMSFYKACDGGEFTSLANRSLDKLDLSPLLPLNRAVLFCRLEEPASTFSINGAPLETTDHTTILRIVLPVEGP